MNDQQADQRPDLVLIHEQRPLDPEPLAGGDLAYLLRETWRRRGADWQGATLPSGRPVTPELWRTFERLLIRARLARRRPVRGAPLELLATHRQALEVLRWAL